MGTTGMAFQQVNSKEFRTAQEVSDLDPDKVMLLQTFVFTPPYLHKKTF